MAFTAIKWIIVLLVILAIEETSSTTKTALKSDKSTPTPTPTPTKSTEKSTETVTVISSPTALNGNETLKSKETNLDDGKKLSSPYNNKGLLKRMLYVAIAFSVIVALYFIIKTIRTKARKSKSKKYGMIYSSGDVEMQPLEDDQDDEDDMTVFDRKTRK